MFFIDDIRFSLNSGTLVLRHPELGLIAVNKVQLDGGKRVSEIRIDLTHLSREAKSEPVRSVLLEIFRQSYALAVYTLLPKTCRPNHLRTVEDLGFRWCAGDKDSLLLELARPEFMHTSPPANKPEQTTDARVAIRDYLRDVEPLSATFGTGSSIKYAQYAHLLRRNNIRITQSNISGRVPEPQVDGSGEKAEQILVTDPLKRIAVFAAREQRYPLLVEDTMLFVEQFNNDFDHPLLPGPDTKRWWGALGDNGLLRLMEGSKHRRAKYVCQIGVHTPSRYEVFRASRDGWIIESPRARPVSSEHDPFVNGTAFHSVFVPEGADRTYAEMDPEEFQQFDYRRPCADQVADYLWKLKDSPVPSQIALWE